MLSKMWIPKKIGLRTQHKNELQKDGEAGRRSDMCTENKNCTSRSFVPIPDDFRL
jgi:hypothetical protein